MTKAIMQISPLDGVFFDCTAHADDHDACTIMSTLCNVLVEATLEADYEPTIYEAGHVRIDMEYASEKTNHVFQTVWNVMKQAEKQMPDYIKLY